MNKFMLLFVYFTFLGGALTLICYKCDSTRGEPCGSNVTKTIDCGNETKFEWGKHPQCVRMFAYDGFVKAKEYIARDCSFFEDCKTFFKENGFLKRIKDGAKVTKCYTCDEDRCNSVTRTSGSISLPMVLATLVLMFFIY